jgi:hypothetical protein
VEQLDPLVESGLGTRPTTTTTTTTTTTNECRLPR